jgi:hypothetical protein
MQGIDGTQPVQNAQHPIIWTPRFIALFGIVLLAGLSLASLFTQSWLSPIYPSLYVFLTYLALIFLGWGLISYKTHSQWLRLGAYLGCVWAIAMGINYWVETLALDPQSTLIADVNTASNCVLLAAFICLSIAYTPMKTWDFWLFRAPPMLGCAVTLLVFFSIPADVRSQLLLESCIAALAIAFSVVVWWLRPACWRLRPGPTFLFGLVPLLLLLPSTPAFTAHNDNLFTSQLPLLCMLLGILRVLKGERAG